jgi:hypothetical protein
MNSLTQPLVLSTARMRAAHKYGNGRIDVTVACVGYCSADAVVGSALINHRFSTEFAAPLRSAAGAFAIFSSGGVSAHSFVSPPQRDQWMCGDDPLFLGRG